MSLPDPTESFAERRHPVGLRQDYSLNTERPASYEPGAIVFADEVRRARHGAHRLSHCANARQETPMALKTTAVLAACALLAGACAHGRRATAVRVDAVALARVAPLPDAALPVTARLRGLTGAVPAAGLAPLRRTG
jgi:hypothetical protein